MIVCDMAGTIIQENGIVYKALYNTVKLINPRMKREEINDFHGCSKREVINYFVDKERMNSPEVVKRNLDSEFNYFLKKEYTENPNVTLINNNIPSFFNALRDQDIKICLNTGYNKDIQKLLIDKFNLHENIDDYISSEEVSRGRPYPHMIKELMRRNNINDPKSIVKIGDSLADILEGKNVGCMTVGVLSGAESEDKLKSNNPDFIIDNIMELKFR